MSPGLGLSDKTVREIVYKLISNNSLGERSEQDVRMGKPSPQK